MTTVLIVDSNDDTRTAMESQLSASNQFERVLSCSSLEAAKALISQHPVKVMLIESKHAGNSSTLQDIKASHPELGVVLLQGTMGQVDAGTLLEMGAHAQTSCLASTMEIIASVAKALVVRLRPSKRIMGKFLKDGH